MNSQARRPSADVEGVGDLQDQPHGLRRCERPAQRRTVDVFQYEIARTYVMNLTDVRMVQRRNRARFLLETTQAIRIGAELGGQDLDGDIASEPWIAGLVDLAHTACPKGRDDLIRAKANARGEGHEIAVDYMVSFHGTGHPPIS